jgi:hypothetical protein
MSNKVTPQRITDEVGGREQRSRICDRQEDMRQEEAANFGGLFRGNVADTDSRIGLADAKK